MIRRVATVAAIVAAVCSGTAMGARQAPAKNCVMYEPHHACPEKRQRAWCLVETGEIRALVEGAGERAEGRIAARLSQEVPVRLGRERGQREIAHAVPNSVGERYASASPR